MIKTLFATEDDRRRFEESMELKAEAAEFLIEQSVKASQEIIAKSIKEIQSVIGPHGSVTRLQAGGVRVTPGGGVSVFTEGVRKTSIEQDGDFFVGSNVEAPNTTVFSVFAVEQPYNNEQMLAGDLLIGDNSDNAANIKYDSATGRFNFRGGQTVQVYIDTNGTVVAGGGAVVLSSTGISSTAGLIGGWTIDSTSIQKLTANVGIVLDSSTPLIKVGNTAGIYLVLDGANQRIRSSDFVTGQSGFQIATDTGNAEFNNLVARGELKTFLLTSSNQMAVAGNIMVTKDAGKIVGNVSTASTVVNFGKALTVGDWIKVQGPDAGGNAAVEWMLLGSLVSGTSYNVTRNVDGSGTNDWLDGTPFVVIGHNGDSRIELVAGSSATIKLITQGSAWNTGTTQAEMSTVQGAITAGAGNVIMNSSGISITALSFPSANYIQWTADNDGLIVARSLGWYTSTSSGSYVVGRGKNSSHKGVSGLAAQPYSDTDYSTALTLALDTEGVAAVDLRNATLDAHNNQALYVQTNIKSADNNVLNTVLYLDSSQKGTTAAGFGSAMAFRAENASGTLVTSGYIGMPFTDATNATEDAQFGVGLISAGALVTAMTLDAVSGLNILAGTYTVNNNDASGQIMGGHGLAGTVGAGATNFLHPTLDGILTTARNYLITMPGTFLNLYATTATTQPNTGSMVFTAMKNGSATALVATVAANAAAGTVSDTTHSFTVAAGDTIRVNILNNASGASAQIGAWAIQFRPG